MGFDVFVQRFQNDGEHAVVTDPRVWELLREAWEAPPDHHDYSRLRRGAGEADLCAVQDGQPIDSLMFSRPAGGAETLRPHRRRGARRRHGHLCAGHPNLLDRRRAAVAPPHRLRRPGGPRRSGRRGERRRTSGGHRARLAARRALPVAAHCDSASRAISREVVMARAAGRTSRDECAGEDLNLHGVLTPQGPQPCASTNSATSARGRIVAATKRGQTPTQRCDGTRTQPRHSIHRRRAERNTSRRLPRGLTP